MPSRTQQAVLAAPTARGSAATRLTKDAVRQQARQMLDKRTADEEATRQWLTGQPTLQRRLLDQLETFLRGTATPARSGGGTGGGWVSGQALPARGDVADSPMRAFAADAFHALREFAPTRADLATGMMAKGPAALAKLGAMAGLTNYHGSPWKFAATANNPLGEFTASKIGAGEGAQMYGTGLYTAEIQPTAKNYRRAGMPAYDVGKDLIDAEGNPFTPTLTGGDDEWYGVERRGDVYLRDYLRDLAFPDPENSRFVKVPGVDADWQSKSPFELSVPVTDELLTTLQKQLQREHDRLTEKIGTMLNMQEGKSWGRVYDRLARQFDDVDDALEAFPEFARKVSGGKFAHHPGYLYTLDLPDDMAAQMLNWDFAFARQPEAVQAAVLKLNKELPSRRELLAQLPGIQKQLLGLRGMVDEALVPQTIGHQTGPTVPMFGKRAYEALGLGSDASRLLQQYLNVPGIRYFDGFSRAKQRGTSNFVTFPGHEQRLRILKREQ